MSRATKPPRPKVLDSSHIITNTHSRAVILMLISFIHTVHSFHHYHRTTPIATTFSKQFKATLSMNQETHDSSSLLHHLAQKLVSTIASTDTPMQCTMAIAGGGATSIPSITSIPNSSRMLLQGYILYSKSSIVNYIQCFPSSFSSVEVAQSLAHQSLLKSISDTDSSIKSCIGVGCTGHLRTQNERSGRVHKSFVRLQNVFGEEMGYNITLSERRNSSRLVQEQSVGCVVLMTMLEYLREYCLQEDTDDLEEMLTLAQHQLSPEFDEMTKIREGTQTNVEHGAQRILSQKSNAVILLPNQNKMMAMWKTAMPYNPIIIPGSFNPIHIGHISLARAAATFSGEMVLFELSVMNADKPPLEMGDIVNRVDTIYKEMAKEEYEGMNWGVLLTSSPLFVQKVEMLGHFVLPPIYPQTMMDTPYPHKMTFAIGTDTLVRILNPKYYKDSQEEMLNAIRQMKANGVHFRVGGRLEQNKDGSEPKFVSGEKELASLPEDVQNCFTLLSEAEFRVDISSTELRKRAAKKEENS